MHRALHAVFLLFLLALLAGCEPEKMVERIASDTDKQRAIELIEKMRRGDKAELAPRFAPSLASPDMPGILEQMAHLMPAGEPRKRTLVGAYVNYFNGVRSSNLTYQYDFGDRWFLVNCAYTESGPDKGIVGMRILPIGAPLKARPEFSLRGKSPAQYGTLAAAFLALTVTLVALVRCARDRTLTKKWLWIPLMLVGAGQLSVDWTSGAWQYKPLFFLLFSASAVFQPYGSWVVSAAVPAAALVYLFRGFWNHPRPRMSNAGRL